MKRDGGSGRAEATKPGACGRSAALELVEALQHLRSSSGKPEPIFDLGDGAPELMRVPQGDLLADALDLAGDQVHLEVRELRTVGTGAMVAGVPAH